MRYIFILFSMLLFCGLASAAEDASRAASIFKTTSTFTATDGKTIYEQNCAGCHMHKGEGAKGAGMYPALANNSDVENPSYTAYVVMYGLRGMPSFEPYFTDEQITAVANHVSTEFGNKGKDKANVGDIKAIRPEKAVEYVDW